ncbi:putative ribonuclease H-like domain-containing protein [Tanacetum coccineum]
MMKEISLQELDKMQLELVVTLCLLEKFFPPSFLDIMIHLTVHLTRERNSLEGCIAEETIAEETIEFFSEYHKTMKTIGILPDKHVTNENEDGKPMSTDKSSEVSGEVFQKAHLRYRQVLKTKNPGKRIALLKNEHNKSFAKWLREEVIYTCNEIQVERELAISKDSVSETINVVQVKVTAVQVKIVLLMIFKENIPSEEIIRGDLHLEDVEGVECLPNSEIFKELATMGFEKPPPKLTFYKAFFAPQWKFLIHTLIQCLSAKRTAWNEFSSTMASAFSQVSDVSTVYTNEDVEMPVDEEQPATTSAPSTSEPQDQPSTPHDSPKQEPTHSSPHDSPITGVNPPRTSLGAEENASKQEGMISDIDADAEISFVDETQRMDDMIFDTTTDLGGE